MPTYEYACRDCGHTFEIVQSMQDDALTVCPECGGALRKVFAPPAIAFKGSGFYTTDQRKKAKAPSSEKTEAGKGDSAGKGGSAGAPKDEAPKGEAKEKPKSTSSGSTGGSKEDSSS